MVRVRGFGAHARRLIEDARYESDAKADSVYWHGQMPFVEFHLDTKPWG